MSDNFYESEIVIESLDDIVMLQTKVILFAEYAAFASVEDQKDNLSTLRLLLEKQKNMFLRCMLSDCPSAKQLMCEIIDHFRSHGVESDDSPLEVFDLMAISLDEIENDLNEQEKFQ